MSIDRRAFLAAAAAAAVAACSPVKQSATVDSTGTSTGRSTEAATTPSTAAAAPTTDVATTVAATTDVPTTAAAPASGGPARFVARGPAGSASVALTFHANGRLDMAAKLLELLKSTSTPITVFAVGTWIEANPGIGHQILDAGHELANHSWSHGAMRTMTAAALDAEITKCGAALARVAGSPTKWFRPSQIEVPTESILAAAGRAGYGTSVGYSLDTLDFQDPGASVVKGTVIGKVKAGDILSLHFDHQNTLDALPAIIEHLHQVSLAPVTLTQLFG